MLPPAAMHLEQRMGNDRPGTEKTYFFSKKLLFFNFEHPFVLASALNIEFNRPFMIISTVTDLLCARVTVMADFKLDAPKMSDDDTWLRAEISFL